MLRTAKTPQRNVQAKLIQMEERLVSAKLDSQSKVVLDRANTCTGIPIYCTGTNGSDNGPGSRGTCVHCKTLTHWYCVCCKRWACVNASEDASKLDGWKGRVVLNPDGSKPLHCNNSCFQEAHRQAQLSFMVNKTRQLQLSM